MLCPSLIFDVPTNELHPRYTHSGMSSQTNRFRRRRPTRAARDTIHELRQCLSAWVGLKKWLYDPHREMSSGDFSVQQWPPSKEAITPRRVSLHTSYSRSSKKQQTGDEASPKSRKDNTSNTYARCRTHHCSSVPKFILEQAILPPQRSVS